MAFSLEMFESYAYSRDREMAMRELFCLLRDLDLNYGSLGPQFIAKPLKSIQDRETDAYILTRIVSAITCLLADSGLNLSREWQQNLMNMHRWLSALFSASPFRNADHVIRSLNVAEDKFDLENMRIETRNIFKFCFLYTSESEIPIDLDALWEGDPVLTASLCLVLISPRFLGSPLAHGKRELILPWLSSRLEMIDDIDLLPVGVLHDLYMHCSYADTPNKHDIKMPINRLIRRKFLQFGLVDVEMPKIQLSTSRGPDEKPVMLVILEWFGSSHSIYRTHSRTIESARRHFHVVGMAYPHCVDEVTKEVFDEFISLIDGSIHDQLSQIQAVAIRLGAEICYMPSVGMFPLTMWLSNLRVAPLQIMALGHPATTHAHAIDYVVVEEDYVGDEKCFSEKLLKLPRDGMPYRPSASAKEVVRGRFNDSRVDVVQIVVCSTTMKLNPLFFRTCALIAERSSIPVHFRFLVGQAQGITFINVQRVIASYLGDQATAYPHQSYGEYMDVISKCDMFLNPFPFGNTNGIIDTVSAGLVGICKTGREVHEHIDQGIFERLNFPSWMVAKSIDEYIEAAIRLIENKQEREGIEKELSGPHRLEIMFKGNPEAFGDGLLCILQNLHQQEGA